MKTIGISALACMLVMVSQGASATADGCAVVLKTPDGFLNLRNEVVPVSETGG